MGVQILPAGDAGDLDGARQGLLMVPTRFAQALSPWRFGLAIGRFGADALWFSAALGGLGLVALMLLQGPRVARTRAT